MNEEKIDKLRTCMFRVIDIASTIPKLKNSKDIKILEYKLSLAEGCFEKEFKDTKNVLKEIKEKWGKVEMKDIIQDFKRKLALDVIDATISLLEKEK